MKGLELTSRDCSLFKYLHEHKVATNKQINRDIFKVYHSVLGRRLKKLRNANFIEESRRDHNGDKSIIFNLGKRGYDHVTKEHPDQYLIQRYKSNSIDHDLRLVDVKNVFSKKSFVTGYWTENILQTSLEIADDELLSQFRIFQFDALLRLDNRKGSHVLCGLEYEASSKSQSDYEKKLSLLYRHDYLKAVLYICKSQQVEGVIKRIESKCNEGQEGKIYYALFSNVLSAGQSVTFKNLNGHIIEIR